MSMHREDILQYTVATLAIPMPDGKVIDAGPLAIEHTTATEIITGKEANAIMGRLIQVPGVHEYVNKFGYLCMSTPMEHHYFTLEPNGLQSDELSEAICDLSAASVVKHLYSKLTVTVK